MNGFVARSKCSDDGSFMPHEQCPMAEVLSDKISELRDAEVLIERPDGSRITVLVNIRPLKNQGGELREQSIALSTSPSGRKRRRAALCSLVSCSIAPRICSP